MTDPDLINEVENCTPAPCFISKGALSVAVAVAKYNVYKKEGSLFIAISPGCVDTGNFPGESFVSS